MKNVIKNIVLCGLALCTLCNHAFSQVYGAPAEYYKNKFYDGYDMVDTTHATPQQWYRIRNIQHAKLLTKDHYYYDFPYVRNLGVRFDNSPNRKSDIYEGLNWGPGNYFRKFFKSIIVDGDCAIELSAVLVNEKNAANFRYHVVQNDQRELVSWTQPSVFKTTADGKLKYAWLGKFSYVPGQVLKVEIYNIKDYTQQDAMIVDWRMPVAADVMGTVDFLSRKFKMLDNGLISDGLNSVPQVFKIRRNGKTREIKSGANFIETTDIHDLKFRLGDSLQRLSFLIRNGSRSYNYKVSLKRTVNGNTDSINLGETYSSFELYKEFWKTPGKYQITFTPEIHKHGGKPIRLYRNLATNISFTVLPSINVKTVFSIKEVVLFILVIAAAGICFFVIYRKNQRRKIKQVAKDQQIATLQLQSVRAQLNPHFVFNALAGIQNLMNKTEIENANKYLSRFARITRSILDDGHKELTTVVQEINLLTDYLQMEQMRFGFEFNINTDDSIDQQTEIPAMLLQPFIENAVKHGVSAMKAGGLITVTITKQSNDVVLAVQDNGKGFSAISTTGMGIKLCNERIALLNSIYKNSSILLHQTSDSNGTTITIELKNWL